MLGISKEIPKNIVKVAWDRLHYKSIQIFSNRIRFKTSGIIVTGDEVLKGQVLDTNSHFFCKKLYEKGIKVIAISKVADDVDIISSEVKKFSSNYDYVLTSGGIGPTHDDVTYEAVAKAFNDKLYYHPELSKLVLNFYKTNDTSHPALKLAYIPTTSKLTYGYDLITKTKTLYPNISVKNVFMFPGVPQLCERLFNLAGNELFSSNGEFYSKDLYLTQNEGEIVGMLNETVKKYPRVSFGSYPKFFHSYYEVKISMESVNETEVNEALEYLKKLIPTKYHIEYDPNPFTDKKQKIACCKDQFFIETLNELTNFLKSNNPNDIFLYFDGGKNSTILLYILSLLYEDIYPNFNINGIYVKVNPKIDKFITNALKNYNLNLLRLNENNFKYFIKCHSKFRLVKGTRKSDPNASNVFKFFENLPVVNPLANWSYNNVWKIIRSLYLPYCELYDEGYTSICHVNALPNSNLITTGPRTDFVYYKKAFELQDEALENAN